MLIECILTLTYMTGMRLYQKNSAGFLFWWSNYRYPIVPSKRIIYNIKRERDNSILMLRKTRH